MPSNGLFIPKQGLDLSTVEVLIPDDRLSRLFARLQPHLIARFGLLPQSLVIFTYIQPATTDSPLIAVFAVQTDHPKRRFPGQLLRTMAALPLAAWREAEDEKWRYAGLPDPAYPIFRALMSQHMESYLNLGELMN